MYNTTMFPNYSSNTVPLYGNTTNGTMMPNHSSSSSSISPVSSSSLLSYSLPHSPTSSSSSALSSPVVRKDALSQVTWLEATVFVGRLPRRTDLNDIYQYFSSVGSIQAIIPSRDTYLFIEYTHPDIAHQATQVLNGQSFRGSHIVVQPANKLTKLFIGNIQKTLDAKTIHDAIYNVEEGLISVELFEMSGAEAVLATMQNPQQAWNNPQHQGNNNSNGGGGGMESSIIYTKNSDFSAIPLPPPGTLLHRGFCFAEFANHAAAHRALVTLMHPNFSLTVPQAASSVPNDGSIPNPSAMVTINELRVDWAEPLHEVSQEVMDTVRILYVGNLPPNYNDASEDYLTYLFSSHTESGAGVERVKRIKNYAFVHFRSRTEAEQAMNALQNYQIVGHAIKIQWSKPPPNTNSNHNHNNMNNHSHGNGRNMHSSNHSHPSPSQSYLPFMNNANNNNNNYGNNGMMMMGMNNHGLSTGFTPTQQPSSFTANYGMPQRRNINNGNVPIVINNHSLYSNNNSIMMMNNNNGTNNSNGSNNAQMYQNRLQKALSAGVEAAASFSMNHNGNHGEFLTNNATVNSNYSTQPSSHTNLSPERLAYERGLVDGLNSLHLANNGNTVTNTTNNNNSGNSSTTHTIGASPTNNSNSFMNSLTFPSLKNNDSSSSNSNNSTGKDISLSTGIANLVSGTIDDLPTIDTGASHVHSLLPLSDRSQDRSTEDTLSLPTESFLFGPNHNTSSNNSVPFMRTDRNLSNGSTSSPLSFVSVSSNLLPSSPNFASTSSLGGGDNRKLSNTLDNTFTNDSARTVRTSSTATALSTGSNKGGTMNTNSNSNGLLVTSTRVTRISDPPPPAPAPPSSNMSTVPNNIPANNTTTTFASNTSSMMNYPLRIPAHPPINTLNHSSSNMYMNNTHRNSNGNGLANRAVPTNDVRYGNPNPYNSNNNNGTMVNSNPNILMNNPRLQAQLHAQSLGYGDINTLYNNFGNNPNVNRTTNMNGMMGGHGYPNNNGSGTNTIASNDNDNTITNPMNRRQHQLSSPSNNNNNNNMFVPFPSQQDSYTIANRTGLPSFASSFTNPNSNGSSNNLATDDFYAASSSTGGNGGASVTNNNPWSSISNTSTHTNPGISVNPASVSSSSSSTFSATSTAVTNNGGGDATVLNDINELNKLWPLSPL